MHLTIAILSANLRSPFSLALRCHITAILLLVVVFTTGCVHSPTRTLNKTHIADNRLALAMAYLEQGQPKKALTNLYRAQQASPHYLPTLMGFAHYYSVVKETQQATMTYQQALAHYPRNSQLLHNFAVFLCQQAHYSQAQRYFNKAIEQPHYQNVALSYDSAAQCWWRAKQKEKAIRLMQHAVNHAPTNRRMLVRLIRMYMGTNKEKEAERLYRKHHQLLNPIQQNQRHPTFKKHHTEVPILAKRR
ncbi:MAG: tetratricopeptide repeat protein [Vibrio sp.]